MEFIEFLFNEFTLLNCSFYKDKSLITSSINIDDFIEVKGWKSLGNKLSFEKIRSGTFKIEKSTKYKPINKNRNQNLEVVKKNKNLNKEKYNIGESIELDLNAEQLKMFDE